MCFVEVDQKVFQQFDKLSKLLLDKTKIFIWFNICKGVGLKSGTRMSINFLLHISVIDEAWLKQGKSWKDSNENFK
jgi:hypothetical protein